MDQQESCYSYFTTLFYLYIILKITIKASISTEGLDEADWQKPIYNTGDDKDYTGGAGRHSFIPHFGTGHSNQNKKYVFSNKLKLGKIEIFIIFQNN